MNKKFSKQNIIDLFRLLFPNKQTLDRLSESSEGTLLYNGQEITGTDNAEEIRALKEQINQLSEEVKRLSEAVVTYEIDSAT